MKKMHQRTVVRGLGAVVITSVLTLVGLQATAKLNTPGQILTAKDDHSSAALKNAAQAETVKKITKAPEALPVEEIQISDGDPIPLKATTVLTEPAPGSSQVTAPAAAAAAVAPAENFPRPIASEPAAKPAAMADKPAAQAQANASASVTAEGVTAEKSLGWLSNGNQRFLKKRFRKDGRAPADIKRLHAGQKPHAIVLACSDSRVPPELVFDQALGEIYTVRVAGEALDSSVVASIEHAVEHYGSKLIVVMGHTKCGAIDSALRIKDGESAGSPALDKLLADIRPRLKTVSTQARTPDLEVESTLNADGVARDLIERSEVIRRKVETGSLVVKPALYRLDSGKVTFY